MEEVVEDAAVELGLGPVVGEEPLGGAGAVFPGRGGRIAEADGEGALFFEVAGHLVGLAVEHRLESVLDAAEEAVRLLHDAALLGGSGSRPASSRSRATRVFGCRTSGYAAAVEELEELDDELDVADAAVAGLDLEGFGAGGAGAGLDPTLQGA